MHKILVIRLYFCVAIATQQHIPAYTKRDVQLIKKTAPEYGLTQSETRRAYIEK